MNNQSVYSIENNMSEDKQLFLDNVKEKILDGNKKYRDLYVTDTFAFLAPDNYGVDNSEDIDVSIETQLQQASKEFDKICNDIIRHFTYACKETNDLDILNHIKRWRVRDFISEASYQALKYKDNHRAFAMWQRVVNIGLQILTEDMLCVSEHLSKYDRL